MHLVILWLFLAVSQCQIRNYEKTKLSNMPTMTTAKGLLKATQGAADCVWTVFLGYFSRGSCSSEGHEPWKDDIIKNCFPCWSTCSGAVPIALDAWSRSSGLRYLPRRHDVINTIANRWCAPRLPLTRHNSNSDPRRGQELGVVKMIL